MKLCFALFFYSVVSTAAALNAQITFGSSSISAAEKIWQKYSEHYDFTKGDRYIIHKETKAYVLIDTDTNGHICCVSLIANIDPDRNSQGIKAYTAPKFAPFSAPEIKAFYTEVLGEIKWEQSDTKGLEFKSNDGAYIMTFSRTEDKNGMIGSAILKISPSAAQSIGERRY